MEYKSCKKFLYDFEIIVRGFFYFYLNVDSNLKKKPQLVNKLMLEST